MIGLWCTEFRRGVALPMVFISVVLGVWILFVNVEWAAEWMSLAGLHRWGLIVTGSLLVSASAWCAGRERRRGLDDLLGSTPLPRWRRHLTVLSTVVAAAMAGHLLAFAIAGAFVVQQTDYHGGGWWWIVFLGCLGLGVMAAAGWLVGTLLPFRLTAPIAGVASYLTLGSLTYAPKEWTQLLPPGEESFFGGSSPTGSSVAATTIFLLLVGIGVILFTMSESRQGWGLLAVASAAGLAFMVRDTEDTWWWTADLEATAAVCNETEPQVCVWNAHAKFLGATSDAVVPPLHRLGEFAPSSAQEWTPEDEGRNYGVLELQLSQHIPLMGSGLRDPGALRWEASMTPLFRCTFDADEQIPGTVWEADFAVITALMDGLTSEYGINGDGAEPEEQASSPGITQFETAPVDQQDDFIAAYFSAATDCDLDAIDQLAITWRAN